MKYKFRTLRTTNEARAIANAEEQGVRIRAKRTRNTLPNAYDDIARSWQRSWKRYRHTQWK